MTEQVVYKYLLLKGMNVTIQMPKGAKILSVDKQADSLYLWALVDPSQPDEDRMFEVKGTGQWFFTSPNYRRVFIGTVVMTYYVWHVFELTDKVPYQTAVVVKEMYDRTHF